MAHEDRVPPTLEEMKAYGQRFSNWGRWGPDDELGTLNHVTPEARRYAASLVREGRTVSCGNPIATRPGPRNPSPAEHRMRVGRYTSGDFIGVSYHGFIDTHLDALCHIITHDGQLYNGRPASLITESGALSCSVDHWRHGIVTRGVLYDIPRLRGVPHVTFDAPVHAWDLEDAARAQGVQPRPGDAVLVRSGAAAFYGHTPEPPRGRRGVETPGVHGSALEFLHAHDAALLGWDLQEAAGQDFPGVGLPIHATAIPYMGMPLLDNADLEGLAATCAELQRWEFLFMVSPLIVLGGTGSPVNPIAVF